MAEVLIPTKECTYTLDIDFFNDGHLSDYAMDQIAGREKRLKDRGFVLPKIRGAGGLSDYAANKANDHAWGKATWTLVTPLFLALCTVAPTASSTGTSITQANYTGYSRLSIAAASVNSSAARTTTNAVKLEFPACTAGSSTIIGWALCDASTLGNVHVWGTCASTAISTTQTPPTISAGVLSSTFT